MCVQYKFVGDKEVRISCTDLEGDMQQHLIKVSWLVTGLTLVR